MRIEIIVVDNGSTDDSLALANTLAARAPQSLFVLSHPHRGANHARLAGFQKARGDYIRWLDADDELAADVSEKQLRALETDARYDIAYCDWVWRQHLGHIPSDLELLRMPATHTAVAYGDRHWRRGVNDPPQAEASFTLEQYEDFPLRLLEDKWLPPHAYLLRRVAAARLLELGAFHPQRSVAQDREFFTFAALLGLRFLHVPDTRVYYNAWSAGQITQRISASERAAQLDAIFSRLRALAERPDAPRLGRNHHMLLNQPWQLQHITADAGDIERQGPWRFRIQSPHGHIHLDRFESLVYQGLRHVRGPGTLEQLAKAIQHVEPELWERHTDVLRALLHLRRLGLLAELPAASTQMAHKAHVLLVTDVPFWGPARGDSSRILALAQFLREHLELEIFHIAIQPGVAARLSRVELPLGGAGHLAWQAQAPDARALPAMLAHVAKQAPFKACLFEFLRLGGLRQALPAGVAVFLDTHDLVSARAASFRRFGVTPPRELTAAAEFAAFRDFDGVILIQEDDYTEVARELGEERCILAPHPVEIPRVEIRAQARDICFVASEYPPNIDGLRWFLEHVWAALDTQSLALHLYGRAGLKVDTRAYRNVVVHGVVKDLAAAYQASDIAINPVRFGAGLKIKTVEAIAAGLPLVTTSEGARGLRRHTGQTFLVADDEEKFREHLEALLDSRVRRAKLAEAAWQLGHQCFTPAACFQPLLERILRA